LLFFFRVWRGVQRAGFGGREVRFEVLVDGGRGHAHRVLEVAIWFAGGRVARELKLLFFFRVWGGPARRPSGAC